MIRRRVKYWSTGCTEVVMGAHRSTAVPNCVAESDDIMIDGPLRVQTPISDQRQVDEQTDKVRRWWPGHVRPRGITFERSHPSIVGLLINFWDKCILCTQK